MPEPEPEPAPRGALVTKTDSFGSDDLAYRKQYQLVMLKSKSNGEGQTPFKVHTRVHKGIASAKIRTSGLLWPGAGPSTGLRRRTPIR
jgi:hypothetical protein